MAYTLNVIKKLHVALLQFVFVHKLINLSLMCFGSCPCVKYRDFLVTFDNVID